MYNVIYLLSTGEVDICLCFKGEEGKLESNSSTSSAECTVVHGETVNVDDQVPSCITDGPDTISNCGQQQLESVGQVRQSLGQYSNPVMYIKLLQRCYCY